MVSFTFTTRRHLVRLASAPFTFSSLATFGWVPFVMCNAWQQSRTENLRRVGENIGVIFTRLWTKVHKIFRWCRRSFVISNALVPWSISRFIQKILAIKSRSRRKTEQMYKFFFRPQMFWDGWPCLFYGRMSERFTVHRLTKIGWVSFADPRQRSLAMK